MSITRSIARPITRPLASALASAGAGGGSVDIVNNGVLAPFVTFTRASTGTYFDSAGVMQTAAANEPRFDYDPDTLALRGLLIEEQRTNLLLNSAALSTQSVTVTAVAHTLSFTGTGTVTLSGASTDGPLVGTGANDRVTLTFTPTAGSLTLTVSGSVTLAQLEAGDFATSYIPTTGTAQTRAADVASAPLSSIGWNGAESTLFAEYIVPWSNPGATRGVAGVDSSGRFIYFTTGSGLSPIMFDGTNLTSTSAISANAISKTISAFSSGGMALCSNGGEVNTTPFDGSFGSSPTALRIGESGQGSSTKLCGHIRRLRYYPRRLPNTELQALTA